MNPISKVEAQELLAPFINRLNEVIFGKINFYYNGPTYAAVRHEHSTRSDASICHDLIKKGIETEFEGTPAVRFTTKKGLFMMIIKDAIVLRFKKFNKNLLSNGIMTNQATFFNLQDVAQLELDGLPPDGLLHVGYIPNELETGVGEIYVTYRYGNKNVWTWEITSFNQVADVLPFTTQTEVPATQRKTKPRRQPKLKGKDENVGEINADNI